MNLIKNEKTNPSEVILQDKPRLNPNNMFAKVVNKYATSGNVRLTNFQVMDLELEEALVEDNPSSAQKLRRLANVISTFSIAFLSGSHWSEDEGIKYFEQTEVIKTVISRLNDYNWGRSLEALR